MIKRLIIIALLTPCLAFAGVQKVCINKTDKTGKVIMSKDGKPQQTCRLMKKHSKLKGTKVPAKVKK